MKIVNTNTYLDIAESYRKQFHLEHLWNWIQENNEGRNLPYHNNYHMNMVTGAVVVLAEDEGANIVTCMCAAMLHDMNHTGNG